MTYSLRFLVFGMSSVSSSRSWMGEDRRGDDGLERWRGEDGTSLSCVHDDCDKLMGDDGTSCTEDAGDDGSGEEGGLLSMIQPNDLQTTIKRLVIGIMPKSIY